MPMPAVALDSTHCPRWCMHTCGENQAFVHSPSQIQPFPAIVSQTSPSFFFLTVHLISLGCAVCGILVPQPGLELTPPAVEAQNSNHWTPQGNPPSPLF